MGVKLNHTIVWCRDKRRSATFLTEILGSADAATLRAVSGGGSRERGLARFSRKRRAHSGQHYAFLIGEEEFDQIFGRMTARAVDYWADPGLRQRGQVNRADGGRGVYFHDPDGHLLEIITRPYGGG